MWNLKKSRHRNKGRNVVIRSWRWWGWGVRKNREVFVKGYKISVRLEE
jgi:hypothetical protein